jgi:ankyrin repeat protein
MRNSINKNIEGRTPLMHAAFDGELVRVIALLSEGADPNARDSGGDTALMFAAMCGHLLVVKVLLGHGADPALPARNGWKALQFAVSRGHTEVASLLSQAEQNSYREGMPILKKGAGRD